jgi:hypothetical protein
MKTISVTDLKLIPQLAHLRMLDFINPTNDELIAPYLKQLGFDLDYPIEYLARQHRNLQGKVVIAYMIAGEVECNSAFLHSPLATVEDRIIAAGYRDLSLASQLSKSLSTSREYDSGIVEGFPPDLVNPDEDEILMQIRVLEDLLLEVRGEPFKNDGSRKTLAEQHVAEEPEKKRKKVVSSH